MKNLLSLLLFCFLATAAGAQDRGLYWKYKDYDGAITVTVPAWAMHVGSWFLNDKADRKLVRKLHKVRVMVFQDGSPITKGDWNRFNRKASRRNLNELVTVRDGKTHVKVLGKDRGGALRKVVVIVDSPEDGFVLVSMRGKLRWDDINRIIRKYDKEEKGGDKVPQVVKLPTSRV